MMLQGIGREGRLVLKSGDICRTSKSQKFRRISRRQFLELQTKKSFVWFQCRGLHKNTMYKTVLNPKQILNNL